jgi:hypothetical protein
LLGRSDNEDSNHGPGRLYRPRAAGSVRSIHGLKAAIVAEAVQEWRAVGTNTAYYNRIRPHAPEVFLPALAAWPAALRRTAPPATLAPKPTLN